MTNTTARSGGNTDRTLEEAHFRARVTDRARLADGGVGLKSSCSSIHTSWYVALVATLRSAVQWTPGGPFEVGDVDLSGPGHKFAVARPGYVLNDQQPSAPTLSRGVSMAPAVYAFDHDHGVPARTLTEHFWGKGAELEEMTTAPRLPMSPGLTIGVPLCRGYLDGWPVGLSEAIDAHCADLGRRLGRRFGDAADPLLLAVRSGAPRSVPGLLDTVLDLGLTERTVAGLTHAAGDTGARTADGRHLAPGDDVTLDGTTGEVWFGGDPDSSGPAPTDERAVLARDLPELSTLDGWTAQPDRSELR